MNLSNINNTFWSHPKYEYTRHVENIAASFEDNCHKEAAYFHDLGKLSDEFQKFIRKPIYKNKTTHAFESALCYLSNKNFSFDKNSFENFLSILKHHGDLENTNEYLENKFSFKEDILNKYPNLENRITSIYEVLKNIEIPDLEDFTELFDTESFVEDNSFNSIKNYFNVKESFSKLIFADKFESIFKESFKEQTKKKWDEYLVKLLKLIQSKSGKLSAIRNEAREQIIYNYKNNCNKKLFIIEAPTGIGKTLAALHLALKIAQDKKKKRLITALPMTSIIDQTYSEYLNIFNEDELLKFHYLTKPKHYVESVAEENSEQMQDISKISFISGSWALDSVIVTTFNQILNLFFSNKNRDLVKFHTLRDSVIILDEIQALPRILLQDISKVINFFAIEFNIDFILMSATIPEIKPLLDKCLCVELLDNAFFSMDFNNRYILRFKPEINTDESLIEKIQEEREKHNSILCVLNTKKLSLNIFEKLEDNGAFENKLFLLNTNFIPLHRKRIINIIKQRLFDKKKTILISTQVIEAGVDLDFDFGIREFAPLYCIIQTAGRVNRENKKQNSNLIITETIGRTPYHKTDLIKDVLQEILPNEVAENKILPILKQYFKTVQNRTHCDLLLFEDIELLNFETVYKTFYKNFMKTIPYITSVFIEIEDGLYDKYYCKLEKIYELMKVKSISLEKKLSLKNELKSINKEISQYIINIPEKQTQSLPDFTERSGIKVCRYEFVENEEKYSLHKGWIGTDDLEVFF